MKLFKILIVTVVGIALPLVFFEVLVRLFSLFGGPQAASDRPDFYYKHERASGPQDLINSGEKPARTFRIAAVGDSITFAPNLQVDDAYPARLERLLNLNDTELKAEVLNYGVPGLSTLKEIPQVQKALDNKADLVILQITLNDPEKELLQGSGLKKFGPYVPPQSLRTLFSYWHSLRFVAERIHNAASRREYKNYFFDLFDNPETWGLFTKSASSIIAMTKGSNVRLVPVIFPLFGFPIDDQYPFTPLHQKIIDFFSEKGIEALDLHGAFKDIPQIRLEVIPGADLHPNEIAHRIAAEEIYRWLKNKSLIPGELVIKSTYRMRTDLKAR
jgi:lysophospholipase L1-like esterase